MLNRKNSDDEEVQRLRQEISGLRKAIEELSLLNVLSGAISSTMSLDNIMQKVVSESVKAIKAEQGTINLLEKDDLQANPFKTMIRKADETTPRFKYRLDQELSGWMLTHNKPLLVNDFQTSKEFGHVGSRESSIKSLLSVPLVCKGNLIGVLNLFNKKEVGGFTIDDQRLLTIIATQSAQVIENARLYAEEKRFHQLEQELEMAKEIQERLLPKESPTVPNFDIAGASYPAKNVGGDYFDFFELEKERWCIALGDVAGKGIPAALLMSHLQATMRNQAMSNRNLVECISKTNNFLCRNTEDNKFVTLFCGILDPGARTYHYVNAGHNYPYHVKATGEITPLKEGGLVVGMLPDVPYEDDSIEMQPGDVVVIYSDGVTEANNEREDMFGEARLQTLLKEVRTKSAKEIVDDVYEAVKKHEASSEPDDDITVVVIKSV